jgi:hypothetical protein
MDVHKETVSIAVRNSAGKLVMESILETKAMSILWFVQGMREKGARATANRMAQFLTNAWRALQIAIYAS